jgi:hypothetical protein
MTENCVLQEFLAPLSCDLLCSAVYFDTPSDLKAVPDASMENMSGAQTDTESYTELSERCDTCPYIW